MDTDPVMTAPAEVLALAEFAKSGVSKYDTDQVRFGWDAEGPYALATNTRVMALARWARPDDDDRRPAAPVEFGVGRAALAHVAAVRTESGLSWADAVILSPGSVRLDHRRGGGSVQVNGARPGEWVAPNLIAHNLKLIRGDGPADAGPLAFLCPAYLHQIGRLAGAVAGPGAGEWDGGIVRLRPVRVHSGDQGGGWLFEVGERPDAILNRGLRVWALVMGLAGTPRAWSPSGGIKPPAPPEPPVEAVPVVLPAGWKWDGRPNSVRFAGGR